MALETTNYQCLSCGGPLRFDSSRGVLTCDHCDSSFAPEAVEEAYAARQQQADARAGLATDGVTDAYTCSSCGAQLVYDGVTAISNCPYCGNPAVVPGILAEDFKPDLIIPFKLERDAATKALEEHYKGKKFLPKEFVGQSKIQEIQGVYVPFWLYNAQASGKAWYEAKDTRVFKQGDYQITETDYYDVYRSGSMDFERIPVDGSSRMPDAHMDAIEPFNYEELRPYSVAYLPGFLASRYDENVDECRSRAEKRVESSVEQALADTVSGYGTVSCTHSEVDVQWKDALYALFPVWMLTTQWNDESFLFAMNGQSGKLIGNLPVSKAKVAAWFFGIFALAAAVFAAIVFGFGLMQDASLGGKIAWMTVIPAVIAGIVCFIFYGQMKTAVESKEAGVYLQKESFYLRDSKDDFRTTKRTRLKA